MEQSIERVQQQQVSIQAVEQIEAKPLPLTSKVAVDREDYQKSRHSGTEVCGAGKAGEQAEETAERSEENYFRFESKNSIADRRAVCGQSGVGTIQIRPW